MRRSRARGVDVGRAESADRLLCAAESRDGWERIQITSNCLVLAENLAAAGETSAAKRICGHLRKMRTDDSEKHIREAAERGRAVAS